MARYKITLTVESTKPSSVEKKLLEAFGADLPIHTIEKLTTPESCAGRLKEALADLELARDDTKSELKEEMQQWLDSICDYVKETLAEIGRLRERARELEKELNSSCKPN